MSQACSSNSLTETPVMPSSDHPPSAHTNRQPLSETPHPHVSEVTGHVPPLNIKASKGKERPHQSKRFKSMARGVPARSINPRGKFQFNIQFYRCLLTKWPHRTWSRARCLFWLSRFKRKRCFKGRICTFRSNFQLLNHTGDAQGSKSPREQEGKRALDAGCDGTEALDDRPANDTSNLMVCPVSSAVSEIPGSLQQHQGIASDAGITTKQAEETKGVVPSQSQQSTIDSSSEAIKRLIHMFLDNFLEKYGSFIPLRKSMLLRHLNKMLDMKVSNENLPIFGEMAKYQTVLARRPMSSFQVVYNKHTLTLEDLATLDGHNWLNDQVMNMYGELIMESAHQKVHFLNSFFHRQLMTKGYEGVRRWTKKVDLFSKTLLLVPIHLEIHWCLVTVDIASKRINLYDSQGIKFKEVAQNILKYIKTEAMEKKQTAFQSGWTVFVNEGIPQQTNENDCGVFVLEYCRCLVLGKPLQFSQRDMSTVRKRIYRELCDCQLST
ncbi:sentrin-specific protease 5-like [Osmerus eperlanus]|uniref:sentrin-specific protease 5-like n=1 Tax=Osmerus eperlanus TaxID=29151 RepID=UPI002E126A21